MIIKIKDKKELDFLEKIYTEVYGTVEDNGLSFLFGPSYISKIVYALNGKEVEVNIHKYSSESGDKDGFCYAYRFEGHTFYIKPAYVEKIIKYNE